MKFALQKSIHVFQWGKGDGIFITASYPWDCKVQTIKIVHFPDLLLNVRQHVYIENKRKAKKKISKVIP
jgi:hypothetical protein